MAHMYPPEPPEASRRGGAAERELYLALQDALDDAFFVFSNLRYVRSRGAREGEIDFLVVHREHGLLVIECKGNGVRRNGVGQWQRHQDDGTWKRMDKGPFAQAQDQVKQLVAILEERCARTLPELCPLPFVHGHAVAFPSALLDRVSELPLNVPREIVYDANDISSLRERILGTYAFWRQAAGARKTRVPTAAALRRFRRRILNPMLDLVPCLGAGLAAEARAFVRLTEQQRSVVEGWLDNPRMRVKGGAGTGKTVLALEAARTLADEGASVLLLCFNLALREHLKAAAKLRELPPTQVKVQSFHGLCAWASWKLHNRKLAVPDDPEASRTFWEDEAPLVLLAALEAGALPRWDAIVIDEAQDFAAGWWAVTDELLKQGPDGRMLVFYDPAQEIYGRGLNVPEYPSVRLTRNFRNTREIAKVVRRLGGVRMRSHDACPEGRPPVLHPQTTPGRARSELDALVKRLVGRERLRPEQIVVLTPHSKEHSLLAERTELGGLPLATKPEHREGAVLHATFSGFKGLESDVVILADVDPNDERCTAHARYVAASRARHELHVFSRGDWLADAHGDPGE